MEETRVLGENHLSQVIDKLYHIMLYRDHDEGYNPETH